MRLVLTKDEVNPDFCINPLHVFDVEPHSPISPLRYFTSIRFAPVLLIPCLSSAHNQLIIRVSYDFSESDQSKTAPLPVHFYGMFILENLQFRLWSSRYAGKHGDICSRGKIMERGSQSYPEFDDVSCERAKSYDKWELSEILNCDCLTKLLQKTEKPHIQRNPIENLQGKPRENPGVHAHSNDGYVLMGFSTDILFHLP